MSDKTVYFPAQNTTREEILNESYAAMEQVLKELFGEEEGPEDRWREFLN